MKLSCRPDPASTQKYFEMKFKKEIINDKIKIVHTKPEHAQAFFRRRVLPSIKNN
ncbi:MAG: hypothetical protein H7Y00_08990 [Fimbriimonadaceae bacterium]|nr:hypothetical protein [Chitinophagales bacterium]